jgi:adenosine deaminase
VVGIDLAGGPATAHAFRLHDYARPFARAARAGLGRTVHAAEGRPPEEIRTAIEALGAQRIGHGTTLFDDPSVLELVLKREVTVEACPTSNVHTGVIPSVDAHPLPRWLAAGVRATVCADNTLLSAVTTREEYERASSMPGMTPELHARAAEHGFAAVFRRR